jgi:hypothetical protein
MSVPPNMSRAYALTLAVLSAIALILWVALQPLTG